MTRTEQIETTGTRTKTRTKLEALCPHCPAPARTSLAPSPHQAGATYPHQPHRASIGCPCWCGWACPVADRKDINPAKFNLLREVGFFASQH